MPLFEVAIIETPTKKGEEEGEQERLVFGPKAVVARNAQTAAIVASREMEEEADAGRMEVLVRPFA